jgi:hypothetical protein
MTPSTLRDYVQHKSECVHGKPRMVVSSHGIWQNGWREDCTCGLAALLASEGAHPQGIWAAKEDSDFSGSADFAWIVLRPSRSPEDSNVFASRMSKQDAVWLASKLNAEASALTLNGETIACLLAYGEEEKDNARKAKDLEQYQFHAGFVAALQRVIAFMPDVVCVHGTAVDVHCCNCHSGFIFNPEHECPSPSAAKETKMAR